MGPSPEAITQHADDLRLTSSYDDLTDWIEQMREQSRPDTPEGVIAGHVFERLFTIKAELEPLIEKLAVKEAGAEAERDAESAEYDRRWAEIEGAA